MPSCFFSACRRPKYNECLTNSIYPALVPNLKAGIVQETVVMDTRVDPETVDKVTGLHNGKKAAVIWFGKGESVCLMKRLTGTQWGSSVCGST